MDISIGEKLQKFAEDKVDADKRTLYLKRTRNIVGKIFYYLLLLSLSFVFLYPLLYMISQSFMATSDVADATIQWIPRNFNFYNYLEAFASIDYWSGLLNSVWISFGSAILQILSTSLIGYGFARYSFPGKGILLALVLFTFLVPPTTIVVPLYMFYSDLGWINTLLPFIFPAALGHGLNGAIFVLIFMQFYRGLPSAMEEAAKVDGAGPLRTYWKIMFPLAKPAMVVVFLLSVVWHWNDVFQPNLYLLIPDFFNLAQNLAAFHGNAVAETTQQQVAVSDAIIGNAPTLMNQILAATMLTILPILILYLFVQRSFVEGIERSGITGE